MPKYKLLSRTCKLSDSNAEWAVDEALKRLIEARNFLKDAGCPKTLARVRLAISSVKGAARNVAHRKYRRDREFHRGATV